ncbi:adenylate/guanylate cyclase domain-containing protein [Rhodospirillales bacterium TMPK1]|uniref:Adenylate/guanylate cyclase domain-containing protein n=2 Tax=Roseiterribacter gracilis TaxID=2812848 RepID=A0A8S8XCN4_9PROT|nr:adenylate/guanylate cyclase domain-containing protein [Rhodospirillales bacterium TMPK1]
MPRPAAMGTVGAMLRLFRPFARRWFGAVVATLLLFALAMAIKEPPPPVLRFRLAVLDLYLQQFPRPVDPAKSVRIIDIDEESLRRFGQWPWPRTQLAELVDRLAALGAKAIVFDVLFDQPDRTSPPQLAPLLAPRPDQASLRNAIAALPDHDKIFAGAIARARSVVLGFSFVDEPTRETEQPTLKTRFDVPKNIPLLPLVGAVRNRPEFEASAAGNGHFNMQPDPDGLVRRVPLLAELVNTRAHIAYPSIDVEAVRLATEADRISPIAPDDRLTTLKIGGLRVPVEADATNTIDGFFRLWFSDNSNHARFVPAYRVFENGIDAGFLKGRVVLIGTSAKGLLDMRATPMNQLAAGVENHAEAIEQMLSGQFITRPEWSWQIECGGLVAAGLLIIVLAQWRGAVTAAIAGGLSVGGACVAAYQLFERDHLMLDPLTPSFALTIVYALAALTAFARSEGEKRHVREAFGRYLAPSLVERLAAHPERLRLGGEMRDMSILFSDIRGFTAMSQRMDPTELTALLNGYLTPMTGTVLGRGGTIDKYIGDAVMAFWNAPLDDAAHAENACRAALAMLVELDRLNALRPEGPQLRIGIGVNTGPCCVGNLGSEQRFAYSAIGDAVNVAARLEGQTKFYGVPILIGEETRLRVPSFAALEVDHLRVVGRDEATRLYALLGDERVADVKFTSLAQAHEQMLQFYRARRWDQAAEIARALATALPAMATVYATYEARVRAFAAEPPPPDWDGTVIADSK